MFNLLFLNFLKNFIILFTILILFVFVNGYDVSPDKKFLIVAPDFIPWRGIGKFIILPGWNLEENDNYQLTYSIYNNENDKNIVENSSISLSSKELTLLQIQNLPTHNIYLFNFEIDGKKESFKIYGGVNIKHIYIQSDKKIYRPNEKVRIVALPIKDDGTIYNYPLIFSILDSRKVKTVIQKVYYSWKGNFYHYEFTLPKYNCSGRWTILVHPTSSYNIPSHHFNTTIFVQDYVLPMYNFFIDVKPTNDEFIYEINVLAKHSIGKNAIGNIEIEGICDNKNTITLIGPEVMNGLKRSIVNIKDMVDSCENIKKGRFVQLKGIFTELSSGNSLEKMFNINVMGQNFDIILLKPYVTTTEKKLYFILKNMNFLYDTGQINISVSCFNTMTFNYTIVNNINTEYSKTFHINLENVENCKILLVEGRSAKMRSIIKILVPVLNSNEIIKSFSTAAVFQFEEDVIFNVNSDDNNLNYIIMNKHNRVVMFGLVKDKIINVKIKSEMVGTNYLIVFSTRNTKIIDMILFIGSNLCQNTNYFISSKKTILFFNDTYEGHIKGPDNGLALMKVYDKRLTFFDNSNKPKDDFWNLEKLLNIDGFFSSKNVFNPLPPEIEGDIIRNFKPINDLFDEIFEICKNFVNIKTFSSPKKLPTFGNSSCWISNKCTNLIKEAIKSQIQRNKEQQDFYNYTKISSMNVFRQIFKNIPSIENRYITKKLSQNIYDDIIEDGNNNYDNNIRNSEIRDFFPEVWIFDEFTLDENGFASFNFIPPHSITTWIVDADFWKPSTTYTCSIKYNQELEYRKDFFIEVNLPSTIRALETIDISVTVHSLSNSSFDNLYICMDKGTRNSCQNRGRDGSLADNSHFSLKSTTVNNVATKKFEVIFFEENNNEIISFSLRRHVEDDKTFACESNDVYDIIKKSVKILPDIRIDFKSTFLIINPDKKSELFSENELDKDKNFIITEKRDEMTSELVTNITIVPGKDEIVGNLMVTLSEPRLYHMEDNNNDRRKRDILLKYGDSHIYWIMSELSSIFYKKLKKDFINEFIIKEEIPENEYLNIDYSNTLWTNIIKLKKYMVECDKYDFFVDTIDNAKGIKTCAIEDVIKGDNVWITMLNTMMICDLYISDVKQNNKNEMFFNINKLLDFLKICMKNGNLIEYILLPFDVEKDDKKYILYGIYLHVLNSCKFYDKSKNDNEINEIFSQFEDREKEDILSTLFYISSSKRGNDYKRIFAWNDILYCFNYNFKKMPWIHEKIDECEDIFRGSQKYISNPDTNMLINILALYAVTNNFSIPTNYPKVSTSELQDYTLITRNKRSNTNLANEIFLEQEIYKYIIFDMKKRNYHHKKMLDIRIECIPSCHFIPQEDYGSDGKSKVIHFPPQTKTILFKSKGNGKKVALVEGNMLTKINVLKNEYPLKIDVKMYSEKNDLTHMVTIKNLKNQNLDMIQFEHGLYSAGYELKFNNDEGYVIFEDKDNIKYKTKPYRTDNSVVFLIGPLSTDKDTLSYNLTQKAVKAEANDIKLMGTRIILRHPIKGILGKIIVDNRTGFLKNKGDAKEKDSDIEYLCLQNSRKCFCGEGTSNDMCKIEMTDRIERSFNKDLNDKKKFLLVGEITNISTVEENKDYRKFTIILRAQSCKTSFDVNLHVFVRTTNNSNVKCILFSKGDDVMLSGNVENTKNFQNIYHMSNGDVLVKIKENDGAGKMIVKLPFIKC